MNTTDRPTSSTPRPGPRARRHPSAAEVILAAAAALCITTDAFAVAPSACYPKPIKIKWGNQNARICPVWTKPLPIPVFESTLQGARKVGVLVNGGSANWFICQVRSNVYRYGNYTNVWWAWTLADNLKTWGWVPEVYFAGGATHETRQAVNLPVCPPPVPCAQSGAGASQSFGEAPSGSGQTFGEAPSGSYQSFGEAPSATQTFGNAPDPAPTMGSSLSMPCKI